MFLAVCFVAHSASAVGPNKAIAQPVVPSVAKPTLSAKMPALNGKNPTAPIKFEPESFKPAGNAYPEPQIRPNP